MTKTQATQAKYRKTKTGEWVAYGPAAAIKLGGIYVTKASGEEKYETVVRVGRPFQVDGVEMVYGYLHKEEPPATASRSTGGRRNRKSCVSDGNCSSFGTGRSCGGWDCDGYEY